jgi:manganese/zinc/iron transport system permease protein
MFGIGIVLSRVAQNTPHGNKAGLDDFLFGKAAGLLTTDVINIALTTTVSLITITLLCKEFALLCFDREFARAIKLPVKVIDALLTALLCACTAAALPAVGAVLVSALLIFPASTARLWTNRVGVMTTLAALCGLLATTGGTAVSIAFPHLWPETLATPPTGPTIIVCCALLFILSLATAPRLRNKTFTGPRGVETP